MNFLAFVSNHLSLIPTISTAVQEFKAIGHSKETTVAKIGEVVDVAAHVGEAVPVPQIQLVSGLVAAIADGVFNRSTVAKPSQSQSTVGLLDDRVRP